MKALPGMGPKKAAGNMLSIPVDDGSVGLIFGAAFRQRKKAKARKRERLAAASRKRNRR